MQCSKEHFLKICNDYKFPDEAVDFLITIFNRLDCEPDLGNSFDRIIQTYMDKESCSIAEAAEQLKDLGNSYGIHEYTLHFLFIIACSQILLEKYRLSGYGEELFWITMEDLRYKLIECIENKNIVGTFVIAWFDGFLKMKRFTFGRFQYESSVVPVDYTTKSGLEIKKGAKCYNFHIPASGVSMTDEIRLDSYKKAYRFYKDSVQSKYVVFMCASWLLYPAHKEFLPENSNIVRFLNDFEIIDSWTDEGFTSGRYIYGASCNLPAEKLPEDTSLRKAYKQWFLNGKLAGAGMGIFAFDGEKIIR